MIDRRQHLSSDPSICHGRFCAKRMGVVVTNILGNLVAFFFAWSKRGVRGTFHHISGCYLNSG